MGSREQSPSAEIRARLDHPIIDSDGHVLEFQPAYLDVLKEFGGQSMVEQFLETQGHGSVQTQQSQSPHAGYQWYHSTPKERAEKRIQRPSWRIVHTKNTLDRVTATLPRLLYERLDEMGLDFSVLYPTFALAFSTFTDPDLRRAACRAYNRHHAEIFREFADRLTPVALIPMHTPEEALEELEYAVGLGLKAVLMPSYLMRPGPGGRQWVDKFCLDSAHDYDPVWAKCLELKVTPTFHSGTQGLGTRASISNYVYNHIGSFATSAEALCKAAFLGGVTRRFPDLRMAFLEGGVGWACSLYSDLVGHWKKRNKTGIENYDPAKLDHELLWQLHRRYGGAMVEGKLDDERNRNLALYKGNPALGGLPEERIDEFDRCGISRPEDIAGLFVPNFFFGCEADDPINAWAFDARKNPYGARLHAIFSSDIGHWDVPDMREVAAEAFELVEHGLITETDFRDFTFTNPMKLWTHMNPDFFKGTVIEGARA